MKTYKLTVVMLALVLCVFSLHVGVAGAANYPKKPIEVVVPYGSGSSTGVMVRLFVQYAEKYIGQPLVVVEKPGGSGVIGAAYVYGKKADGYTVLSALKGFMVISPLLIKTPTDYTNFKPVMQYGSHPLVAMTQPKAPWNTLAELVADAKKNPGKFKWGNTGFGAQPYLFIETINVLEQLDMPNVAFEAAGQLNQGLLGGHIDAIVGNLGAQTAALITGGELKPLGVFSSKRSPLLPDVPTVQEQGIDKEGKYLTLPIWRGFCVKEGTSTEIIQILHDAFKKAYDDPEFQRRAAEMHIDLEYKNQEDFGKLWQAEHNAWSVVVPDLLKKQEAASKKK